MIEENLDLFTQGDFGIAALIDAIGVWGIFDESYEPLFSDSALQTEGKRITLLVKSSISVSHGSEVIVGARNFEVVNIQPVDDGKLNNLILKEVD